MLKAVRRSAVVSPLSITIPQPPREDRPNISRNKLPEEPTGKSNAVEPRGSPEPLHKQVKFLAADEDDEEEDDNDNDNDNDDMSDQSSICQSPSWEGYGQRKKHKKEEAEKRKKEKAEKEAKAAKKRPTTRLSKAPPSSTSWLNSKVAALTNAERSMSDPMLVSRRLLPEGQGTVAPESTGRAASTDALQNARIFQATTPTTQPVMGADNGKFLGGSKLENERAAAPQSRSEAHHAQSSAHQTVVDDGANPRQHFRKTVSNEPAYASQPPAATSRPENRHTREAFPPSASRTPLLRPTHTRNYSLVTGATNLFRARNGSSTGDSETSSAADHSQDRVERGRNHEGYVHHQRAQSTERALAGFVDEQHVGGGSLHSSSRSSSRHTQHTRRSSFTQEAKNVAMKLAGLRPSSKEDPAKVPAASNQTDYFNFMDESNSPFILPPLSLDNNSSGPQNTANTHHVLPDGRASAATPGSFVPAARTQQIVASYERPDTSQSSASSRGTPSSVPSNAGSTSGYHSRKTRSFKEAAKAALNISRGSSSPTPDGAKSTVSVPPYFKIRARMNTSTSSPPTKDTHLTPPGIAITTTDPISKDLLYRDVSPSQNIIEQSSTSNSTKSSEMGSQSVNRVSEGSSSSSAYEDTSPLPSEATTPNTSRPQSSRGLPFVVGEVTKGTAESLMVQDDERTLRQSMVGSQVSSASSTPRLEDPEEYAQTSDDRWSRTALPLDIGDIGADAEPFENPVLNRHGDGRQSNTAVHGGLNTPSTTVVRHLSANEQGPPLDSIEFVGKTGNQPGTMPLSGPNLLIGSSSQAVGVQDAISVPPRSAKREQVTDSAVLLAREKRPSTPGRKRNSEKEKRNTSAQRVDDQAGLDVVTQHKLPRAAETERTSTGNEPGSHYRGSTTGSSSSASVQSLSPTRESVPPRESYSSPYVVDFPEPSQTQPTMEYIPDVGQPSAASRPKGSLSPLFPPTPQSPGSPRLPGQAQIPPLSSGSSSRASTPVITPPTVPSTARPSSGTPVSILKQPLRSTPELSQIASSSTAASRSQHTLSALPKHMQMQVGSSSSGRPSTMGAGPPEARSAPFGKVLVQCCNCEFYHDMPSKVYECIAKPDAVIEDRVLGISGAITTMVKCPWCQHNMTRRCCPAYTAIIYLKERYH